MRFFVPPPSPVVPLHPLFAFRFDASGPWRGPFAEHLPSNFFETEAQYAETSREADAIILSNNFTVSNAQTTSYIGKYADEAEARRIPLYIFSFGDFNNRLTFDPRAWVFRLSLYKSTMGPRDIPAPTTAEVFASDTLMLRQKAELPTVSFCGFASFQSARQWAGYFAKNAYWSTRGLFEKKLRARTQGVYWRRRAMRALARSPLVRTRFIVRRSFSGALRTIELPPEQARREFIESIQNADFVLAPKGDGNYSNRFLEALSLARIPVLIDTDMALPLEDVIDYSKIIVRVPMKEMERTSEYVRAFYDALTEEEWARRQQLAHDTFEKYLRQDAFFRNYFSRPIGR